MCSWSSGLWIHVSNSDACLCPGKQANKTPSSDIFKIWATLFSVSLLILSLGRSLKTTQLKYHAGMEKKTILFLLHINQNIALFVHDNKKINPFALYSIVISGRFKLRFPKVHFGEISFGWLWLYRHAQGNACWWDLVIVLFHNPGCFSYWVDPLCSTAIRK